MSNRRIAVKLWGKHNRKALIDPSATEGARIGENLIWPDGTLVTVEEIQNPGGSGSGDPATPSVTLWSLILNIPQIIKDFVALAGPGYLYHDGSTVFAHEWPLHDVRVEAGETLTIPANKQYILWEEIVAEGDIVIEAGGELVILGEGLPEPTGPDMTYVSGDLTQIDYDAGEQKLLTYNGAGDLERVDFIQDGTTLRKDLFYTGGGDLDYIDEYYV